jgi:hypothetical protein
MTRPVLFAVLTATAFAAVPAALVTPAQAQIEVQIGTAPPRNGAWGDRDRDGVPNVYDRYDNRRTWNNGAGAIATTTVSPMPMTGSTIRALRDKDHDGVPQAWDRNDNNPWRR